MVNNFFSTVSRLFADYILSLYCFFIKNKTTPKWNAFHWKNMYFANPVAPAGGIDKNAKHIKAWCAFGAGFIEIGTVTPLPQSKNAGLTVLKNKKTQSLWNHLGFPGEGVHSVQKKLHNLPKNIITPIFANIGKNRKTNNDHAEADYLKCISVLYPYVNAFVINISSPNTLHLTELSQPQRLKKLLSCIKQKLNSYKNPKPFFIKWSPDMSDTQYLQCMDIALEEGAQGHIVCNTTSLRTNNNFPKYGGVSGAPLADISKKRLQLTVKHLGLNKKNQLVISVGGILKPEDILERLQLGADLVQMYSALVLYGPCFLKKVFSYKLS